MKSEYKTKNVSDLLKLVTDAKSLDKEAVAEMRSNIQLVAGDHYSRRMSEAFNRQRSSTDQIPDGQKLRITKNNIHRAHRLYVSSISALAPGIAILPRNDLELQDRKDAELNQAVWEYLKSRYKLKPHFRDMLFDFCGPGECISVIKYDPSAGEIKGYEPKVDDEGNQYVDETGAPVPDEEKPVHKGGFLVERRYAHNTFRDPSCQQMKNAKWIGFDIVEDMQKLKEQYAGDAEKQKMIQTAAEDYVVFDSNRNGYTSEKNQTVIHEIFFKKCKEYPEGYFYQFTKGGILEHGPLPGGIFPVIWQGFDEHPTKVRASSLVKIARPFQAEINRASSQAAMASVTIGEDKILYQAGTDLSQGALIPGVRGLKYNGTPPTILPGRTGEQFFGYIDRQYDEMDRALLIDQLDNEKMNNLDPYSLLFRSMAQQQKFSVYAEKFGEFLISFAETFLELCKFYLDDDEVIAAIGKSEAINIAEFRKTSPLYHCIKVEEQDETSETKLGRQLVLNQILQYSSSQLSREDIGKLITQMPFGNWKEAFSEFTIDSRNVSNDFLAIERGEEPKISKSDDSEYILKQVAKRMKERDFSLLHPFVQELYARYEQYHLQKFEQEVAAKKAAQSEFIPVGGGLIACDMYVAQEDPEKAPKRVRVPYQALDWLVNTLAQQGMTAESMEQMNQSQMAQAAQQFLGAGMPVSNPAAYQGQESPGVMQ
jgi:hypothetical protein